MENVTTPSKTTEVTRVLPIPCAMARTRADAVLRNEYESIERRDDGVWATTLTDGDWVNTLEVRLDPEEGETRVRVRMETTSQPALPTERPYWTLLMLPAVFLTSLALKLGGHANPLVFGLAAIAAIAVSIASRKRAALKASESEIWLERARAIRLAAEDERERFAAGVLDAMAAALAGSLDAPHYRLAPDAVDTSVEDAAEPIGEASAAKR